MKYHLPLDSSHAEVIIAPFHDPEHSPWLNVHVESDGSHAISRDALWDSTVFSWHGSEREVGFVVKAYSGFEVRDYDELLVCLSLPRSATIRVALLDADGGIDGRWSDPFTGRGVRQELKVPLVRLAPKPGLLSSERVRSAYAGVALQVSAGATDLPVLSLSWIGLRSAEACALADRLRSAARPDWSCWILPDEAWGDIRFERGLLFDADMLEDVRRKLSVPAWRKHFELLEQRAAEYMKRDPEADFGNYLPNHDARYIREGQHGRTTYHWEAMVLAFVGLVREDRALIRHALRYLMCMVHTRHWTESAEHDIPSSTWSHLSFLEEMTTTSVAILLDWLGFALFPRTRNLIRHRLLQKGMAPVMRDLSSREGMHRMNQGAVFNRSLVLGGLMLEHGWPHFGPQLVDGAYTTMNAVLRHYVKPDGGVHEGIGYLCQTMTATLWALIAYGRARGIDWRAVVRERFAATARYVAAMSAVQPGRAIPAGDCRVEWFGGDALPVMAALCPDSAYADILSACLSGGWVHELTGTLARSGGLIGMVYGPDEVRNSRPIVPDFDLLPDSGKATVCFGGGAAPAARLWVSGHAQNASHAHRDLGQFCLEVGEDPVFVDRGMVQYWFAEAHFLSRSALHNVLTPLGADGEYLNQGLPKTADPIVAQPAGTGLIVPGCDVWAGALSAYRRRFAVTSSAMLDVIDEVTSDDGRVVAVHLHSPHEFRIEGRRALLERPGYRVEVAFPWAERVECAELLIDLCHRPVFHLCAVSAPIHGDAVLDTRVIVTPA